VLARGWEQHQAFVTTLFIGDLITQNRACLMSRGSFVIKRSKPALLSTSPLECGTLRSNPHLTRSFGRPHREDICLAASARSVDREKEQDKKGGRGANRLQPWGKELRPSRVNTKAKRSGWPREDGSVPLFLCAPAYPEDIYRICSAVWFLECHFLPSLAA